MLRRLDDFTQGLASRIAKGALLAVLLALMAEASPLRAELPPPGTDVLKAAVTLQISIDPGPPEMVPLFGQMTLRRGAGTPDTIPMQIVALDLSGVSPSLGRVQATLDPRFASGGQVAMTPPVETPADSFFDVWLDISLPDLGRSFYQGDWYNIQSRTTAIPFFDAFSENFSEKVDLIDQLTGLRAGTLTHMSLNPHPRIDRLITQAQVDWTLGPLSETFTMNGESLLVASETWSGPGPIGTWSFNTELVAMDLTGTSPSRGPMQFTEQARLHSPGQTTAIGPGPTQFPATSFFDVFFDLHSPGLDVFCADPMSGQASISAWPPLGSPYLPPGPCKLYDRATGASVGTLDRFLWVFTQPAGGCVDADGDGVFAPPCGTDCDDADPGNFPGNLEDCTDGRDNNCNLLIDCRDPVCTGRPCDDGDRCTRPDVCVATGVCAGQPVDCNDHDPCTLDRCNPQTGLCEHAPVDCDDQNACTIDSCSPAAGLCKHEPIVCDDNNPCTLDACDPLTGQCRFTPTVGVPCNDGDACTQGDRCVQTPTGGVTCQGVPVSCDDQNPCTLDRCDPSNGQCVHVLNTCDDGDACTTDACNPSTGACEHRPVVIQEPEPIKFGDQVTIVWAPTPDATHWNTYRGSIPPKLLGSRLPGSVYDQGCFESDDSGGNGPTTAIDPSTPPPGFAFYYLVSGENACGESLIGRPSNPPGGVIPNTLPCPTPP